MPNYDEAILRSRRLNPNAPFPILHQAVRIALYDEYAARAFYGKVVEAFGPHQPFANIVRAEQRHVDALSRQCERLGIPRPLDPFPLETEIEPTWRANCERAVAGEIANVRLYRYLLPHIGDPQVGNVMLNLQAASLNNHLPAFQEAAAEAMAQERYHAERGIPPQQAYEHHGPLADLVEKALVHLSPHAGPIGLFSPLLRRTTPSMLLGLAAGGAGIYFYRNRLGRKKQEN
ncbi:ferritin-like domain-containing protein [Methylomonas rivi]|uniref:Ferritin n=1 Tax=Methylomonas rivi TaxID=2952226 RepID=A0ABT1UBH9_9GAMM|nr:ferritin [Methylomonas sp. WSC-6]MCQ8130878.1 ferritin [Methylomonas sp. WSC-6]